MAAEHAATEDQNHHATIEDVEDEADVGHPHTLDNITSQTPPISNGDSVPSSMKGKGRAVDNAINSRTNGKTQPRSLDTQSEEAFPSLGPKKGDVLAGAPKWGAKPSTISSTGRTPTPSSGRPLTMPTNKVHHSITIRKDEFKPASELRKPISEIIRNHNKRSRAPVTAKGGTGGTVFYAEGLNMDQVNESLKEIANEVCAKVSLITGARNLQSISL